MSPPDYILYDLLIYRMDAQRNKRILVDVTQNDRDEISLAIFSWGKVKNHIKTDMTIHRFLNRFFGGMVFKPLK